MFKLREYQEQLYEEVAAKLSEHKIAILNAEVRTGKTHVALSVASRYNNVLFITKKKAISSIQDDYNAAEHKFNITIINYESLHKVSGVFDLVICDESHSISSFPKPSKRTKAVKGFVVNDLLLLTGTLLPESNSQIFHQLWVSPHSPYKNCGNFYKWFKIYGTPKKIYTSYGEANDYSNVDYDKIKTTVNNLKVSFTQEEAGFTTKVKEHILKVDLKESTINLMDKLRKTGVIEGNNDTVLADTSIKMMQKLHQLSSGTLILDSGSGVVLDTTKVDYIAEYFKGKKLAMFYYYKQEKQMIFDKFGDDVTDDLTEFNTTDKHIALQQISGAEGINLSAADVLVFINFGFSNTKFVQAKDRLTTMQRKENDVYYILSNNGIDNRVYKAVSNKKDYITKTFIRDERTTLPKENK
jgi:hypothetical protein